MEYIITRDNSYLAHHGVIGMKWGVRKSISNIRDASNKRTSTASRVKKYGHGRRSRRWTCRCRTCRSFECWMSCTVRLVTL